MPDHSDKFKNDDSRDRFFWIFKEISNAEGNEFEVKCWLLSAMNLYKDELELKCKLFFCLLKTNRFNENDIYAKEVFDLYRDLIVREDIEDFWRPMEVILSEYPNAREKNELFEFVRTLTKQQKSELYKKALARIGQPFSI